MKRFLAIAAMVVLVMGMLVIPVSADSAASRVDNYCTIHAGGDAQVALTVTLRLDTSMENLSFPLPANATDISVNGGSARTSKTDSAVLVDISRIVGGLVGEFTIRLDFTVPNVVKVTEDRQLQLELPLLNGFSLPVDHLSFVVVMPTQVEGKPKFSSTYQQEGIDASLEFVVNGNMITGASVNQLNDHEAVFMIMPVPKEMFPGVSTYIREGNPELIPMLICAGVAMLYWLLFLRTLPIIRSRTLTPPPGITAGELGCRLTQAGGDLTMMVMSWAQMGYLTIRLDEHGRVLLYKRMDMGNERSSFENRVFSMLFAQRKVMDGTSLAYAKLCRKVIRLVPGEKSMNRSNSGNMKLFRWILCIAQVFCGICIAMNMTAIPVLQVLLSIMLGVVGAITAWLIQEIPYRTHLRGKVPVYIGGVAMLIWIVLGIICGQIWIPLGSVFGQLLLGYFAAYGGRRSDLGRQDASRILGLRRYLKKVKKEDLDRLMSYNPDYFFQLAPYALALGVIKPFAANFGNRRLEQCPYIVTRVQGRRTAMEWAQLLADVADAMDERHRRMMVERWTAVRFR